jgi:hypothetical protein
MHIAFNHWTLHRNTDCDLRPSFQNQSEPHAVIIQESMHNIIKPISPIMYRKDIGFLLESENLKIGAEIGVQKGEFAHQILSIWTSCERYYLVDSWKSQENYRDIANVDNTVHEQYFQNTKQLLIPWQQKTVFLRMFSSEAVSIISDNSLDYVYIDARHDYCGVYEDMTLYWPKLKSGGIFAGHDYVVSSEAHGQDWSICFNGSIFPDAVLGAVNTFAAEYKVQPIITYREQSFNSWLIRKPYNVRTSFDEFMHSNDLSPVDMDQAQKKETNHLILHFVWVKPYLDDENEDFMRPVIHLASKWKQKVQSMQCTVMIWNKRLIQTHFPELIPTLTLISTTAWISDIVRLYALRDFGGMYLDTDMHPLADPSEIWSKNDQRFVVCEKPNFEYHYDKNEKYTWNKDTCNYYASCVIAMPKIHPALKCATEMIMENTQRLLHENKKYDVIQLGPTMWTQCAKQYTDINVLATHIFLMCQFGDDKCSEKENEWKSLGFAVGYHEWRHSWW